MADTAIRGWVMDVGAGWHVAAGAHRVVEYLLSPPTRNLPRMPAHCLGILVWQEQMIPVLDLAPVLSQAQPQERSVHRAVVLAYQEAPGKVVRYGALVVRAAPVEVWANDDMACPLPEDPPAFKQFSSSCFLHQEKAIPILDTARLFATTLILAPAESESEVEEKAATGSMETPSPTRLQPESERAPGQGENTTSPPKLTLLKTVAVTHPEEFAKGETQAGEAAALSLLACPPEREAVSAHAQAESAASKAPAALAEASVAAQTQDRSEDAGLPRDTDRDPAATTRRWLVVATLSVAALAAMLYVFSSGSFHAALEPASWTPPAAHSARDRSAPAVESPKPQLAPQHVLSRQNRK